MDASAPNNIIDVSIQNFQDEVVEKSKQVPVLLEFYADEAEPSQQLAPVLKRLAGEYQGKFILARVEIRENQQLVQQLQVRTLPTIKIVFQGQLAESLEGPQEEAQLRTMLDQLTMSPVEMVRAQLDALIESGNRAEAISMLQQAIAEEPKNFVLQVELGDLLVMEGRIDEAKIVLAPIPPETEGLNKPQNRIAFQEEAASLPSISDLEARIESSDDLANHYQLAVRLTADDQIEAALEVLLTMLKVDKSYEDELARKTMIKVFELLGKGNEVATSYRRKMFTFLH